MSQATKNYLTCAGIALAVMVGVGLAKHHFDPVKKTLDKVGV